MGDIFGIEKALWLPLDNHPEISSRGDWANENPNEYAIYFSPGTLTLRVCKL
jgi:hypothetical protein